VGGKQTKRWGTSEPQESTQSDLLTKLEQFEQQNKVVLDYSPKYK